MNIAKAPEACGISEWHQKGVRGNATMSMVLVLLMVAVFFSITVWLNISVHEQQQFVFLANSFLHGDLDLGSLALNDPAVGTTWDTAPFNGRFYWPLGPLPAVVLMPFELVATATGMILYQGYVQIILVFALFALIYRIARRIGYGAGDGVYLAFGFAFATAFLGVAMFPWSWYFSQVLTCLLVFAAIAETAERRRPFILGTLFALALATRVTAALGVLWCIGEVLHSRSLWREKLRSLIAMGLPCFIVMVLLLLYNYARFGDAFEQGYAEQLIPPWAAAARTIGIFSFRHLPGNLYYLLLASPSAVYYKNSSALMFPFVASNPDGMSIFVTSPCFFYMFGLRYRDATSRLLLMTVLVIALPILLYYGYGYIQFGYRYSLDFMPFLYYLLMRNYRLQRGDLTTGFKAVLLASGIWNLYLFAGYFLQFIWT